MQIRNLLGWFVVLGWLIGCGGDDGSSSSNACTSTTTLTSSSGLSDAMPIIGVSSPSASCTSSNALNSNPQKKKTFLASIGKMFEVLTLGLLKRDSKKAHAATNSLKTFANITNDIKAILEADSVAGCVAGVGVFIPDTPTVSCYGPNLDYTNHPNHATPNSNTGSLPSGDVGLWDDEDSDSEACAAAKGNEIVKKVSDAVNGSLKLTAALLCLARHGNESLPSLSETVTVTTTLNTNLTSDTITTATFARIADVDSSPTYRTIVEGSIAGSQAFSQTLTHTQVSDGVFKGRLYGYYTLATGDKVGFSTIYDVASDGTAKFLALSAQNSSSDTDFFTSGNDVDFSKAAFASNGYRNLISMDINTGLGTIYSAWQAGSGDSDARVFRINTSRSGGVDSGVAYFGFGPKLTESTVGTITKMICNWAGPNNDHTGVADKAQGQSMQRNTSGVFVSTNNKTNYAPTNDCNNSSSTFKIAKQGQTQTEMGSVTHELVAEGALGTIPTITAPTY